MNTSRRLHIDHAAEEEPERVDARPLPERRPGLARLLNIAGAESFDVLVMLEPKPRD